jgi:predicted MFS family arabinose efflux permease
MAGSTAARETMAIRSYRLLFLSATFIIFGVAGQAVARGWLARELTGSNAGLGGVMLTFGTAMLVATPFGGVAADRYPKRLMLLGSVSAITLSSFAMGFAVVTDNVQYWMLLAASAVQAAAFAFYLPARTCLISELVPPHLLQDAVVLAHMSGEAARVFAPALAGLMISVAWFGSGGVFLTAGAFGLISALVNLQLPRVPPRPRPQQSPLFELTDAISYLRSNRPVRAIAAVTIGVVMVGFPYLTFLPSLADERFDVGARGYGVMSAFAGFGALVAGAVDSSRTRVARSEIVIVVSAVALAASMIVLGFANSYLLALVALFALGASGLMFQTTTQSLMLRLSPIEYHGRLQSLVILGFSGFGLAALPLGLLADTISLEATFALMGSVVALVALWYFFVQRRHRATGKGVEFG